MSIEIVYRCDMKTKICSECKEIKMLNEFFKCQTSCYVILDILFPICENCWSIICKKYCSNNQREKIGAKYRNILNRVTLSDSYIKGLLCQTTELNFKDIPSDLITLKKEHIKLANLLKERKRNEDNQGSKRKIG